MSTNFSSDFNSESPQEEKLAQIVYLETCLQLRPYDSKVERVFKEVTELFSSQELRQRLKEKGIQIQP
jgi:hypothetical protein